MYFNSNVFQYILSDEAAKKKTVFWLKANAIYLKEQKGNFVGQYRQRLVQLLKTQVLHSIVSQL